MFLAGNDGHISHLQTFGRADQQGWIQSSQFSMFQRRHIIPVNRPRGMDFFDQGLQFSLLFLAPAILLKGGLIDEPVPGVGNHGAIGKLDSEWAEFWAWPGPRTGCWGTVGFSGPGEFEFLLV